MSCVLRITVVLSVVVACSKDKPAPIAPASKALSAVDAPAAPTNLRIEAITDTSATVAWDGVEGATDYDLNYKTLSGRWTNEPHKGTRLWNTIYDLTPGTEYRWAVRAENRDGASDWVFGENFTVFSENEHLPLSFNIELLFADNVPRRDREVFHQAAVYWEKIILHGLPDIELPSSVHRGHTTIRQGRKIDDILILVRTEPENKNQPRWWNRSMVR